MSDNLRVGDWVWAENLAGGMGFYTLIACASGSTFAGEHLVHCSENIKGNMHAFPGLRAWKTYNKIVPIGPTGIIKLSSIIKLDPAKFKELAHES